MPLPQSEIRLRVPPTADPWYIWIERHSEEAKAYLCAINHILSAITPTHLNELRTILKHRFYFPQNVVEDLIQLMVMTDLKGIEFEEKGGCRQPLVYLSPRSKNVSYVGEYSVWVDSERLKIKARGTK